MIRHCPGRADGNSKSLSYGPPTDGDVMNEERRSGLPVCAQGHAISPSYSIEEVRTLEVLVFACEICDTSWHATAEERDAFLRYLESRPGDAVPS
jgi:hypothetical protein